MKQQEINRLKYRRQYLLSPAPIECRFLHNLYPVTDRISLYAHIDLNVTVMNASGVRLILLGDIFDYEYVEKNNQELLADIFDTDFSLLVQKTSRYVGRFVIIHCSNGNISLVTDAASSRKVYYCQKNNETYCASQPHLLAATLGIKHTQDPAKILFYNSDEFRRLNNSNIGNTTCYDDIFQLIPNHYLDYTSNKVVRFWPNQRIEKLPLDEVSDACAKMIKGYMTSISKRYKLMLPVTGGKDSRLLLSATRDFSNEVYYYINREKRIPDDDSDLTIPKSLFCKLNLDFHVIDPYIEVKEDFERIYYENIPNACDPYLPIIFNYYVNFSDRINLPGIFVNIVEDVYELYGKKLSPKVLAECIHVGRFNYAESYFSGWLEESQPLCKQYNLNVLNLLYWEERVANWGTQLQLNKDMAQEEIIPYNSRLLIQTMLSAELKYREKPNFVIFREITCRLWPETLQEPCNPYFKSDILKIAKNLGIMKIVKNIYYRYFHR